MEAYTPIHNFADQEKWRKMFKKELVSLNFHRHQSLFISNRKKVTNTLQSGGTTLTKDNSLLHPTLLVLNVVIMQS